MLINRCQALSRTCVSLVGGRYRGDETGINLGDLLLIFLLIKTGRMRQKGVNMCVRVGKISIGQFPQIRIRGVRSYSLRNQGILGD